MTTFRSYRLLVASVAMVTVQLLTPLSAAVNASASVKDFGWTLFDLTPFDGVGTGITFGVSGGLGYVHALSASDLDSNIQEIVDEPGSLKVAAPFGARRTALAELELVPSNIPNFLASGTTSTILHEEYSRFYSEASVNDLSFSLSPNTLVLFHAKVDVFSSVTGIGYEYTFAEGRLNVSSQPCFCGDSDQSLVTGTTYQDATILELVEIDSLVAQTKASSTVLHVAFTNSTGVAQTGFLSASAYASGLSYVPAIPEPQTWSLLLAGLVLLAMFNRNGTK